VHIEQNYTLAAGAEKACTPDSIILAMVQVMSSLLNVPILAEAVNGAGRFPVSLVEGKKEPEKRPNSLPIFVLLSRICVTP
jgi:hypothetical protein